MRFYKNTSNQDEPPTLTSSMIEESLRNHITKLEEKVAAYEQFIKLKSEIQDNSIDMLHQLAAENIEKNGQLSELRCENHLLRETLEFYADENNWEMANLGIYSLPTSIKKEWTGGTRARKCIQKIDSGDYNEHE